MFYVQNTGEQVKAKFDGIMRDFKSDFIYKDFGEEFAMLYQPNTFDVQVGTGYACIGGRGIGNDEERNTITLPSNAVSYLCLRIDLTQTQGNVGMLYANTTSEIAEGNLNNDSSAKRDLLLAKVTTDSNGITELVDLRKISVASGGGFDYEVQDVEGLEVGQELSFNEQNDISTCVSSDEDVVTVEFGGRRITIKGIGEGNATITINGTKVINVSVVE